MSDENVEKVYRQCQKRERDRERKWRIAKRTHDIRNTFRLVDFEKAEAAEESPAWLSDGGKGVEGIVAACDGENTLAAEVAREEAGKAKRKRRMDWARKKILDNIPFALDVFPLIVRNGSKDREDSLCTLTLSRIRRNGRPQRSTTGAA